MPVVSGIVAALIGTLSARVFGVVDTAGVDWIEGVIEVALATAGVSLFAAPPTSPDLDRGHPWGLPRLPDPKPGMGPEYRQRVEVPPRIRHKVRVRSS